MADLTQDPTSIGSILMKMGVVTRAQVEEVMEEQIRLREDALLGKLLVAKGYCTNEQFDLAMEAQRLIREGTGAERAVALADFVLSRTKQSDHIERRRRIVAKGRQVTQEFKDSSPALSFQLLAHGLKDI